MEAAERNFYRMQRMNENLCRALRIIADGADNPVEIAERALLKKAPNDFSQA